ncbi:MAG: aldehyde dehydrogenase family protein [Acidimicrobiales bacterium]
MTTSAGQDARAYEGFDRMPIVGSSVAGNAGRTAEGRDPYTGEVLVTIPPAGAADVDHAYVAAREAQREWGAQLPGLRGGVMKNAATSPPITG